MKNKKSGRKHRRQHLRVQGCAECRVFPLREVVNDAIGGALGRALGIDFVGLIERAKQPAGTDQKQPDAQQSGDVAKP
jgi:hypothetical protein